MSEYGNCLLQGRLHGPPSLTPAFPAPIRCRLPLVTVCRVYIFYVYPLLPGLPPVSCISFPAPSPPQPFTTHLPSPPTPPPLPTPPPPPSASPPPAPPTLRRHPSSQPAHLLHPPARPPAAGPYPPTHCTPPPTHLAPRSLLFVQPGCSWCTRQSCCLHPLPATRSGGTSGRGAADPVAKPHSAADPVAEPHSRCSRCGACKCSEHVSML